MERSSRIYRAQAVAIPPATSSAHADVWLAAMALALLALALLAP